MLNYKWLEKRVYRLRDKNHILKRSTSKSFSDLK